MDTDPYDCQTCGACCIDPSGDPAGFGYVAWSARDAAAVRRLGLPVASRGEEEHLGTAPYTDDDGQRLCVAFTGKVGGRCACSIYEDRPQPCRTFKPGSMACRMARHEAGLGDVPAELEACLQTMARLEEER